MHDTSANTLTETAARLRESKRWIPGEVGIWAFILMDMCTFAFFFATFARERGRDPEAFAHGRETLNATFGAANTFLLLTASLCVALAVRLVREGNGRLAQRFLLGSGVCGAVFVVNKVVEWSSKLSAGHEPNDNDFYQLFFIFTGIHLLHVLIAMVVLTYLWRVAGSVKVAPTVYQARFFENGASYWHLVDLLWLVLFALLYLMA
jgi:nitric oxide reductase NorE protein